MNDPGAIASGTTNAAASERAVRPPSEATARSRIRFKAETGVPIGESIIRARLEKAKELLSDTSLPHEEIADACGLSSASHMAALFRRRFGAAPSSFR